MSTPKRNVGITYGLITGLVLIIISLIQYLGGIKAFMSPLGYLVYIVLIVMAVLAAQKQKGLNGGFLEFPEALKVTFTVFALGLLMQTIFTFILFQLCRSLI